MEMLAVLVNTLVVLACGLLGMLLKGCLKEKHTQTIVAALGLCTVVIGITGAIATSNILIVILCLAAGTLLGELLNMESRLDGAGEWLKKRASKGSNSRFTEGFVTASLLFCVGSMAIMGSFDAGLRGDNSTIFAKSALDGIMAITFGATMGLGVVFSALSVFVYQGLLTLLAGLIEPLLSAQSITEMSAVGGVMLMATGINILGLGKERIRVGNMLPALLLPPVWFALRTLF
jgi:uncharacterized membrane protein YqgA involved in biofilm formation